MIDGNAVWCNKTPLAVHQRPPQIRAHIAAEMGGEKQQQYNAQIGNANSNSLEADAAERIDGWRTNTEELKSAQTTTQELIDHCW